MSAVMQTHKILVEAYHRMGAAGIFEPEARIELIRGELIDRAPIGSLHANTVDTLSQFFSRNTLERVSTQNPVRLLPDSEPQPDVMVLRGGDYRAALPTAADVLLLIEVSDATVEKDAHVKVPLYAEHGIPEAWIVDLHAEQLVVYTGPTRDGYGSVKRFEKRDSVMPAHFSCPSLALSLNLALA